METNHYLTPKSELHDLDNIVLKQNPHSLKKQLAGLTLALVIGLLILTLQGKEAILLGLPILILSMLIFVDAWKSGIYKNPKIKKFTNISPVGWAISAIFFMLLVYPVYALQRNKLKTRNAPSGYWISLNVIGLILVVINILQIWMAFNGHAA